MANMTPSPEDVMKTEATMELTPDIQTSETNVVVDDSTLFVFTVMNYVIICQTIVILGTVSNVINIIVFVKSGFKDSVNVTLVGLALSDLGACVTLIWLNICLNPWFQDLDLPFDAAEIHYLLAGWPHAAFTRVTSCITAFITFERCLCVVIPLKVKNIITPKRVTLFIVCMFIFIFASVSPVYYTTRHDWKFYPSLNKTRWGLVFTDDREEVDGIAYAVHSITIPIGVFIAIVTCTSILVISLKRKSKWRNAATANTTTNSKPNATLSRDIKVSKMVVAISVLFIICFIPVFMTFIGIVIVPEFSINGQYKNLFFVVFSYHFTLESANSALNIFIYYKMSSNYRAVFDKIFRRQTSAKDV